MFAFAFAALASPASAACFADYKAKRDTPLRLHYGVAEIDEARCDKRAASTALERRLAQDGWTLLNVLSVFDEDGLEERKKSAGPYFLRY
ncbi:MAG: hypothetical protein ABNH26_02875 [Celeribacter sp.]